MQKFDVDTCYRTVKVEAQEEVAVRISRKRQTRLQGQYSP